MVRFPSQISKHLVHLPQPAWEFLKKVALLTLALEQPHHDEVSMARPSSSVVVRFYTPWTRGQPCFQNPATADL